MKYRQKPIEVDAFRFTKDSEVYAPEWFSDAVEREEVFIDRSIIDGREVESMACKGKGKGKGSKRGKGK